MGKNESGKAAGAAMAAGMACRRGFTLLEVILSLLIIGLLAGAALVDFGEFHRHQRLRETSGALRQKARAASRSSAAWNVDYRLCFEPRRFYIRDAEREEPTDVVSWKESIRMEIRRRGDDRWRIPKGFDWVFPGSGVAEPLAVRFTGPDGAFVEMHFNPLTGAVDEERAYFP